MAALVEDKQAHRKDGIELPFKVKIATTIFGGSNVCVGADGYAVPGADTAGLIYQGVATQQVINAGASGAKYVVLRRKGLFLMEMATAITIANVGDNVFLVDDQLVDLTANVTNKILCGIIAEYVDTTHAWVDIEPAIQQADVATHIADASGAHAASAISLADAGNLTPATTVEGVVAEMLVKCPVTIADPGNAGAIPVTRSGNCAITSAGAETRTLAIPGVAGIELALSLDVDGGDAVVTVASAINQAGNNTITLNDAGDTVVLKAVKKAGALIWRVVVNDGATLSTV